MPNVAAPIFRRIIRTLADVTHYADHGDPILESCARDCADLLTRLKPRPAPAKTLPGKSRSVMRRTKIQEKKALRDAVKAQVQKRAKGRCECCGQPSQVLEVDEFRGGAFRWDSMTLHGAWALTPRCHRRKTDNKPDAASWNELFYFHLSRHGYPIPEWLEARRLSK